MVLVLVVVAACRPAMPPLFPGAVEAPIQVTFGGTVIVPVEVDGVPLRFIVDTGASITALVPRTAKQLGIVATGRTLVNDSVEATVGFVDRLKVAGVEHLGLRVAIVDLPATRRAEGNFDGILGLDVLGHHDVVIDFARKRLAMHRLGRLGALARDHRMSKLEFEPIRHGLVLVAASVDGHDPMPAVLDLGSPASILNKAAARQLHGDFPLHYQIVLPREVKVGDLVVFNRPMYVSDLPLFARWGLASEPAMLLGADVFGDRAIVLLYDKRTLLVSK